MWDFENGETAEPLRQHFQISYTVPARCAEALADGTADIGIIPVAAYTKIPDLAIIPEISIAAKEKVRSILLISKVPAEKIRSVATDNSSRTSAALVQIYLKKFVGITAGYSPQKPDLKEMLLWHDAGLLIGDPALQAQTRGFHVYDLAEEWRRWTFLPFVFAVWAVRKAALREFTGNINIARVFQQSRDHGLQHVPEIAGAWAPRLSLDQASIQNYLTRNVDYSLDSENIEGLKLFFRYAAECKVLPPAPELDFLVQPSLTAR